MSGNSQARQVAVKAAATAQGARARRDPATQDVRAAIPVLGYDDDVIIVAAVLRWEQPPARED